MKNGNEDLNPSRQSVNSFPILYFVPIFHVPVPPARSPFPFLPLKCSVDPLPQKSHKIRMLGYRTNEARLILQSGIYTHW